MRAIDADALKITLDTFATIVGFRGVYDRGQVMECIDAAPTVGGWISVRPGQTEVSEFGERGCLYTCGACNAPLDRADCYCRRCGKRVQWTEVL